MKRNLKKVSVILLLCTISVGSYFVSGTYAKYTKALSGKDTATVAKFDVKATDNTTDKTAFGTSTVKVKLFDTINEEDTTTTEESVKSGLIAPGTGGSFIINLVNNSEVDVSALIKIEETNDASIPVEYSIDKTNWYTANGFYDGMDDILLDYAGKTGGTSNTPVTIYWRWTYEGTSSTNYNTSQTDETDTKIGETTPAPTITDTVTVIFTQED